MALLKVFVSSTCYDFNMVRGELRSFITAIGHEPVMSEYNDVLFDPRVHTHESCIKEIPNSDVVILIIGSRYGGTAIPKAINSLDLEKLKSLSKSTKLLDNPENISITQLEILKAIESNIPIFTFVDSRVLYDHLFYEKNKDKKILNEIDFPTIENKDNAIYIFEFINFLRLRSNNNSIAEFSKISDIEDCLKKQWSALFQRLLFEQRFQKSEFRRIEIFSEELKDIKSLILSSISPGQTKDISRGVLKYRRLIEFFRFMRHGDVQLLLRKNIDWETLLKEFSIKHITVAEGANRFRPVAFLVREDDTFYETRYPVGIISRIASEWDSFRSLSDTVKAEIISAIMENESHLMPPLRYRDTSFYDYIANSNDDSNKVISNVKIDPNNSNNSTDDETN